MAVNVATQQADDSVDCNDDATPESAGCEPTINNAAYSAGESHENALPSLPSDLPIDPNTGLPYEVPIDPDTGLPYETPADGPEGYKVLAGGNTNYAQGYDGQLTDADYRTVRPREERSTQRRAQEASTMGNTIYVATGGPAPDDDRPATQAVMVNAVYAIPLDTAFGAGASREAPTYGVVSDFQSQPGGAAGAAGGVSASSTTHVVDDVAYVAPSQQQQEGAEHTTSSTGPEPAGGTALPGAATSQPASPYDLLYAQEPVNLADANASYAQVSAEDPAVYAQLPQMQDSAVASSSGGYAHANQLIFSSGHGLRPVPIAV